MGAPPKDGWLAARSTAALRSCVSRIPALLMAPSDSPHARKSNSSTEYPALCSRAARHSISVWLVPQPCTQIAVATEPFRGHIHPRRRFPSSVSMVIACMARPDGCQLCGRHSRRGCVNRHAVWLTTTTQKRRSAATRRPITDTLKRQPCYEQSPPHSPGGLMVERFRRHRSKRWP